MNIVNAIRKETASLGQRIAVVEGDRRVTYSELLSLADRFASELEKCGIGGSQRVALLCDDSVEYIAISLAVLSLQAAIVPVPSSLSRNEIESVLDQIDVNHFLFDGSLHSQEDAHRVLRCNLCTKKFLLYHRTAKENLPAEYYVMNPAFIRFTSGTTGTSKGVVLSHQSIIERTDAADRVLNLSADDVVIWVLSMSFHFVVTILLFLRRGVRIVLCGSDFPGSLIGGLKGQKATFMYASPFHYHLITHSSLFSKEMMSGIRFAISTAMQLPVQSAQAFHDKFGFELVEAYGIIEVGLPFVNDSGEAAKRGSVGRILPDYEVMIHDPDSEGVGSVYLKGAGMFDAYFSPWRNRAQVLSDGWFDTGDLGRLDRDRYLFIVGRGKNVINFAGMKIFPYEVESVLHQHPAIKESLVYGVPHPQYGQLPSADIVLREGYEADFDRNEVRRFCYRRLAQYKVPKEFHCVPGLERTASYKIKRR
jgi:long-chain acyl-CoA synthetase